MSAYQSVFNEAMKVNTKLSKLRHDLRVAEEEVNGNTVKDNYELYLTSMLTNAAEKHEKELAKLKEEYERKVQNAVNAYDRTKLHCETQLQGIQERKLNTPRIRKLKAEIKINEEDFQQKMNIYETANAPILKVSTPTPPPPQGGVVSDEVDPPPTPAKRDAKGKRLVKTVSATESTPIVEITFPTDIKSFATGLQHGNHTYIRALQEYMSNESGFQTKYGYSINQVLEHQAKLFPPQFDEEY